jgi:hypothetical protein
METSSISYPQEPAIVHILSHVDLDRNFQTIYLQAFIILPTASSSSLTHYPSICGERSKKTTKYLIQDPCFRAEIWIHDLLNTKQCRHRCVAYLVKLAGYLRSSGYRGSVPCRGEYFTLIYRVKTSSGGYPVDRVKRPEVKLTSLLLQKWIIFGAVGYMSRSVGFNQAQIYLTKHTSYKTSLTQEIKTEH